NRIYKQRRKAESKARPTDCLVRNLFCRRRLPRRSVLIVIGIVLLQILNGFLAFFCCQNIIQIRNFTKRRPTRVAGTTLKPRQECKQNSGPGAAQRASRDPRTATFLQRTPPTRPVSHGCPANRAPYKLSFILYRSFAYESHCNL